MILCLICARKGSKRLPGKNLKLIDKVSLLARSILHAKSCKCIDEVIVSTDCNDIATEAKKFRAKVPFIRPPSLALDDTPEWKVWQHAIKFYNNKDIFPSTLVILPTTAPLRKIENIKTALNIYHTVECDGVISVTESFRNPTFNMVKKNKQGFAELAIPTKDKIFRTQDADLFYDVTTVCYVMNPTFVLQNDYLFDGRIKMNHICKENSADIDSELDLKWAKFMIKSIKDK